MPDRMDTSRLVLIGSPRRSIRSLFHPRPSPHDRQGPEATDQLPGTTAGAGNSSEQLCGPADVYGRGTHAYATVLEPTLALMALHTVEIAGVSAGGSTRGRHAGR